MAFAHNEIGIREEADGNVRRATVPRRTTTASSAIATWRLYHDEDGKGGENKALIAILDNKPNLGASDFVVI